ncbi:MAG TPA: TolC family protein [Kineobactrum sp.]
MIHRTRSKGAQSIRGTCLAAFGLLALATSAAAEMEPKPGTGETLLSLDRALAVARADNPLIAIDRARKAHAEGTRMRSRQGFSPRLSLSATHLRLDTSLLEELPGIAPGFPVPLGARGLGPAEGQVAGVQLVQPLVNVSAWNAHRQASSALDAAELSLHRSRREVDAAVVEAYFGARTAGRQVVAEQKGLATALRALRQAEAGFEQELLAPVDVLSARTRVAEMEARVAVADASVIAAHAMLRRILGMDGDAQLVLTDPVPQPRVPEPEVVINQEILSNRRDLQALERGLEAAEFGVRRARAAWLPDINLYARYDRLYGNNPLEFDETGWLLAVHLRWTLFAGFSQIGALDEAQATEAETRARLQALRQQAWAEVQNCPRRLDSRSAGLAERQ